MIKVIHNMRHFAATTMLEAGIDMNVIQKILGPYQYFHDSDLCKSYG